MFTPQNILITGGAGFIGSNVCVHLVSKYPHYRVFVYDKLDYCATLKNLEEVANHDNYTFIKGDILSADLLMYVLKTHKIDTIMHFAAQTHVDNSFGNSITFTSNNVLGTHVLLECAKSVEIKRFVFVSTDEVYGESSFKEGAIETSTMLYPTNPYAATKAGAEHLVKSYYKSFQVPIIISRGGNVYGPKQFPEKVIPRFIGLLMNNQPCTIHGNGEHKRSFLYVSDVVNAFDIILHQGQIGETYNIGTSFEISNLELAHKLISLFGLSHQKGLILFVEDRPFNDLRYSMNSEKLRKLGWTPQVQFDAGLQLTINWYKSNLHNWPTAALALLTRANNENSCELPPFH